MKRVIFVEPKIENSEAIFDIFKRYNPDSSFVNPHICIVFPFESDLQTSTIESLINNALSECNGFDIQLSGLSVSYEEKNNFLFLNVIDDSNMLKQMSNALYNYLGDNAELRGEYTPHITIGKSKSVDEISQMYNYSKDLIKKIIMQQFHQYIVKNLLKIAMETQNLKMR